MIYTKETCGYNLGSPNPQVTLGEGLSQEVIRIRKQSYPFVAKMRDGIEGLIEAVEKEPLTLAELFSMLTEYRGRITATSPEPVLRTSTNGTTAHLPDNNS